MSRTNKHILQQKVDTPEKLDELSMKDLFSFPGAGGKKFKPDLGRGTGITPLGKLVAKNANRSVIKRDRQQAKNKIIKELE